MLKLLFLYIAIFLRFGFAKHYDLKLPPWLRELSNGLEKNEKVIISPDCYLKVEKPNKCSINLLATGRQCSHFMILKNVLNADWGGANHLLKLTRKTINTQKFYVTEIQLNICSSTLKLQCTNTESISFLEQYFFITNTTALFQYTNYKSPDLNSVGFGFELNGSVEINDKSFNIKISRKRSNNTENHVDINKNSYEIQIYGDKITFGDILSTFRLEEFFFINIYQVLHTKNMKDIEIKNFNMTGLYKSQQGFYLAFRGFLGNSIDSIEPNIEIVIVRSQQNPIQCAFVLKGKLEHLILPFLLKILENKKRHIPILDQKVDLGILTISNNKIVRGSYNIETDLNVIPKGVTLQTISAFQELRKRDNVKSFTNTTRLVPTQLSIYEKRDSVEFNPDVEINLIDFLEKFEDQEVPIEFPDWLQSEDHVVAKIKKVDYNGASQNKISVKTEIIGSFSILFEFIKLEKIELELLFDKDNKEDGWNCGQLKQKEKILEYDIDFTLTCDEQLKNMRIIISIPCFKFDSLLEVLKVDILPDPLKEPLKKVTEFQIKDFRLETTQGGDEFMRILGSPLLFGMNTLTLEVITWMEEGNKKFALGIVLKDLELADLLEKMIGKKISIAWIGGIKAAIIISNTKLEGKEERRKIEGKKTNFDKDRNKRSSMLTSKYNPYAFTPLSQNYNLRKYGSLQSYNPNMLHPLTKDHLLGKYHAGLKEQLPSSFGVSLYTKEVERKAQQHQNISSVGNSEYQKQLTKDSIEKASLPIKHPPNIKKPSKQSEKIINAQQSYSKSFEQQANDLRQLQTRVEDARKFQNDFQKAAMQYPTSSSSDPLSHYYSTTTPQKTVENTPVSLLQPKTKTEAPKTSISNSDVISFDTEIQNLSPGSFVQSETELQVPHQNPDITSSLHLGPLSKASGQLKNRVPAKIKTTKASARLQIPMNTIRNDEKQVTGINPYKIPVQDFVFIATSPKSEKKSFNKIVNSPHSISNVSFRKPMPWSYYYNKYKQMRAGTQNAISRSNFSIPNTPAFFHFATAGMFPQIIYNPYSETGSKRSDPTQIKNLQTFEDDMSTLYGENGIKRMPMNSYNEQLAIDKLIEAYKKNNKNKEMQNYEYQKNLNSGILDGDDKRSKIPFPFSFETLEDFEEHIKKAKKRLHKQKQNKNRKDEMVGLLELKNGHDSESLSENILNGLIAKEEANAFENIGTGIVNDMTMRKKENAIQSNILMYASNSRGKSVRKDKLKQRKKEKGRKKMDLHKNKTRKQSKNNKREKKKEKIQFVVSGGHGQRKTIKNSKKLKNNSMENVLNSSVFKRTFSKSMKPNLKHFLFKISPHEKFFFANNKIKDSSKPSFIATDLRKEPSSDVNGVSRGSVAFIPETSDEIFNLYREKIPTATDTFPHYQYFKKEPRNTELKSFWTNKKTSSRKEQKLLSFYHHFNKTIYSGEYQPLNYQESINNEVSSKSNITKNSEKSMLSDQDKIALIEKNSTNIPINKSADQENEDTLEYLLHESQKYHISNQDFINLLNENSNTKTKHKIYVLEKKIDRNNKTNYKVKAIHSDNQVSNTTQENVDKAKNLYSNIDNSSNSFDNVKIVNQVNNNQTFNTSALNLTSVLTSEPSQQKYKAYTPGLKEHIDESNGSKKLPYKNFTSKPNKHYTKVNRSLGFIKGDKVMNVLSANVRLIPDKNGEIQVNLKLNLDRNKTFSNYSLENMPRADGKSKSHKLVQFENKTNEFSEVVLKSKNHTHKNIHGRNFPTTKLLHKPIEKLNGFFANSTNDFMEKDIEESAEVLEDASKLFKTNVSQNRRNKSNDTPIVHLKLENTDVSMKINNTVPSEKTTIEYSTTKKSIVEDQNNSTDDKEDILIVAKPADNQINQTLTNSKKTNSKKYNQGDNIFHLNMNDFISEIDNFRENASQRNSSAHVINKILNLTKYGDSKQIVVKFDLDNATLLEQNLIEKNLNKYQNLSKSYLNFNSTDDKKINASLGTAANITSLPQPLKHNVTKPTKKAKHKPNHKRKNLKHNSDRHINTTQYSDTLLNVNDSQIDEGEEKGFNIFGDMMTDDDDEDLENEETHSLSSHNKEQFEGNQNDLNSNSSPLEESNGQEESNLANTEVHKTQGSDIINNNSKDKPDIELEEDDFNKEILRLIDNQANPQLILDLVEKKYDDEGNIKDSKKDKPVENPNSLKSQLSRYLSHKTFENLLKSNDLKNEKNHQIPKASTEKEKEEPAEKHIKTKPANEEIVTNQLLKGIDSMLSEGLSGTKAPKTITLENNKKLKVLMEVRHDGNTNDISVETEGLEHLYNQNKLHQLPDANNQNKVKHLTSSKTSRKQEYVKKKISKKNRSNKSKMKKGIKKDQKRFSNKNTGNISTIPTEKSNISTITQRNEEIIDDSLLNSVRRSKQIETNLQLDGKTQKKEIIHMDKISTYNQTCNDNSTTSISSTLVQPTKDDFLYEREIIHNSTVNKFGDIIEYFKRKKVNETIINNLKRIFIQHLTAKVNETITANSTKRMELLSPLNQAIIKIESDDSALGETPFNSIPGDSFNGLKDTSANIKTNEQTNWRNFLTLSNLNSISNPDMSIDRNNKREDNDGLDKKTFHHKRNQNRGVEIKGINDISVGYYSDQPMINQYSDQPMTSNNNQLQQKDVLLDGLQMPQFQRQREQDLNLNENPANFSPLLYSDNRKSSQSPYGDPESNNMDNFLTIPDKQQMADDSSTLEDNSKFALLHEYLKQQNHPISNPNMFPMINNIKGNSAYAPHNVVQRVLPPNIEQLIATNRLIENARQKENEEDFAAMQGEELRRLKEKEFLDHLGSAGYKGVNNEIGGKRNAIPNFDHLIDTEGKDLVESDEIKKNKINQEFDYKTLTKRKNKVKKIFARKNKHPKKNNRKSSRQHYSSRKTKKFSKQSLNRITKNLNSNASLNQTYTTISRKSKKFEKPTKRHFVESKDAHSVQNHSDVNSVNHIQNYLQFPESSNESKIDNIFPDKLSFQTTIDTPSSFSKSTINIGKEKIGTTAKGEGKNLEYGKELSKFDDDEEKDITQYMKNLKFKNVAGDRKPENIGPETIRIVSKLNKPTEKKSINKELLNRTSGIIDNINDFSDNEKPHHDVAPSTISLTKQNHSLKPDLKPNYESNHLLFTRDKGVPDCKRCFLTNELANLEIDEGVALDVDFSMPSDCSNDKICEFMKEKLGDDASFKITGLFTANGVKMTLSYSGKAEITDNISLEDIKLAMNIEGADSNIFISARLVLADPPLKFTGKIQVSATGKLEFEMKMEGIWVKAFGVDTVAIGNAILKISYMPGAPMPGFELGGTMWFGVYGTGKEIEVTLFFGFDPSDPTGNYFYGKVNKLTVDALIQAFDKSISLPGPVKESGFPKGLVIAFTSNPDGIEIPNEKIKIQFGFMLSGTINLLGYEGECKIKLTPEEILIDIKMAPMEFAGGIINFHKSSDDPTNGPVFKLKIGKSDLLIKAEGAVCMLGIQAEASLLITTSIFKMQMKANLFDLLEGSILLEAGTDDEGSSPKFHLEACLSLKVEKLMEAIKKKLNEIADAAKKAIERAREKVAETKELYEKAKSKIEEKEAKIEAKEAEINADTRTILDHKEIANVDCKTSCPLKCYGDYVDNKKCARAFHRWISCRKFVPCLKKVVDTACLAKCVREKLLKRGFGGLGKLKAKMKLAKLKIMKVALKVAKQVLKVTKIPFILADTLLKVVEKIVNIGIQIAETLLKSALEDIFQFHHFCISADLGGDNDGLCVGFNMSISLFKKEISLGGDLCINGKMFDSVGDSAVDDQYPEAKQMGEDLKEKEKDFQKLDAESEKAKNEAKKEDDEKTLKMALRHYIPSPLERYYEDIVYEPDVTFDYDTDPIASLLKSENSRFDESDSENITSANQDENQLISNSSACGNLSRTIYSYNEIANSLSTILQQQNEEASHHKFLVDHFKSLTDYPVETYGVNMTSDDFEKYKNYMNSLKRSFAGWYNTTSAQLENRKKNVISKYINELYEILQSSDVSEFRNYMNSLHLQAENDLRKRNDVTRQPTEEENLRAIKDGFHKLLFKSDQTTLDEKIVDLEKLGSKLELAQTFFKLCDIG